MKTIAQGLLIRGLPISLFVSFQIFATDSNCDWPQWRGPHWNGVATNANPPKSWSETENVKWKKAIPGAGWATPIVSGENIFLLSAIQMAKEMAIPSRIPPDTPRINDHPRVIKSWHPQRFAILCLDRETGERRWLKTVNEGMPHQGHHRKGGFASSSPVTDGHFLYAYFGTFGLYCHDLDGNLQWKKDLGPLAIEDSLGEGSSPALYGDTLVLILDHELQSYVIAIDKKSGNELWRRNRDETSNWSTPRIFVHNDRPQVVVNGKTVCCYDLETGELLWQCRGQSEGAIPMPAVGHGLVFATSGYAKDTLHAIALGNQGDLTDTKHLKWTLDRGTPYVPCPSLWGDELYLLEDKSFFSCLNAIDGERHYFKERLPGSMNFSASPVGAGDRLYLLSERGKTAVVRRGPQFELLGINSLEGTFYASPAIVGDTLFIRSDRHLYCLQENSNSESGKN